MTKLRRLYGKESSARVDTTAKPDWWTRAVERRWSWQTLQGDVEFLAISEFVDLNWARSQADAFARALQADRPRIHPKALAEHREEFFGKLVEKDGWASVHKLSFSSRLEPARLMHAMEGCLAMEDCEIGEWIHSSDGTDSALSIPVNQLAKSWLPTGLEGRSWRESAGDSSGKFSVVVSVAAGVIDSEVEYELATRSFDAQGSQELEKSVADKAAVLADTLQKILESDGGDASDLRTVWLLASSNTKHTKVIRASQMATIVPQTFTVALRPKAWRKKWSEVLEPDDVTQLFLPNKIETIHLPPADRVPLYLGKPENLRVGEELLFVGGKLEKRTINFSHWAPEKLDEKFRVALDSLRTVFGQESTFNADTIAVVMDKDGYRLDTWQWQLPKGTVSVRRFSKFRDTLDARRVAAEVSKAVGERYSLRPDRVLAVEDSLLKSLTPEVYSTGVFSIELSNQLDPRRLLEAMSRCLDLRTCDKLTERNLHRNRRDSLAFPAQMLPSGWLPVGEHIEHRTRSRGILGGAYEFPVVVHQGGVDLRIAYVREDLRMDDRQIAALRTFLDSLVKQPDVFKVLGKSAPKTYIDSVLLVSGIKSLGSQAARAYRIGSYWNSLVVFRRPNAAASKPKL